MSTVAIHEIPLGDPRMREFVAFHWRHYHRHPTWVPQLDGELLGNRILGLEGLLTPGHPYHRSASATHFLASRNGAALGRVSAVVPDRFNQHHGSRLACFGFFETVPDEHVAHALLGAAADWARKRGAAILRGPGEYGNATHERQGCLVDGFEHEAALEHTWSPPWYGPLIERFGFVKAMDYYAYRVDLTKPLPTRVVRIAEAVASRRELRTRPLDLKRFAAEVRLVVELYNRAWSDNWGFLPIDDWEVESIVRSLRPIVDPDLVRFAYRGETPVAVLGAFPDPNVWLRPRWRAYGDGDVVRLARLLRHRRRIDRFRLMFFGVLPRFRGLGADSLLFTEIHAHAQRRGYRQADVSLLLEHNRRIVRAAEALGGVRIKTWRIFDLSL